MTDEEKAEIQKRFEQQRAGTAPREYTQGRIAPDDDGSLAMRIAPDEKNGIVRLDFGKPVSWLGMSPQDAVGLAQKLIKAAAAISKAPISIEL